MAEKKTFEQTMEELEQVVAALEEGKPDLEEALSLYEKGIKLTKACQKFLDKAQQKVISLTENEQGDIEETTLA